MKSFTIRFALVILPVLLVVLQSHAIGVSLSSSTVCVGDAAVTVSVYSDCVEADSTPTVTGGTVSLTKIDDTHWSGTFSVTTGGGTTVTLTVQNGCDPSVSTNIVIVAAQSVVAAPPHVWTNSTVGYTCITTPTGVSCPCQITWTGNNVEQMSGSSVESAEYTTRGTKSVTAHVGTSSANGTAYVHALENNAHITGCGLDVHRTTVGLGEIVYFTVDPPTSVLWTNTGNSEISASSGSETDFTAYQDTDSSTVTASFTTSGPSKSIGMSVILPNGEDIIGTDGPLTGTLAPPANYVGNDYSFLCRVKPTTVSFALVGSFQERINGVTVNWPNGFVQYNFGMGNFDFSVDNCNQWSDTFYIGESIDYVKSSGVVQELTITLPILLQVLIPDPPGSDVWYTFWSVSHNSHILPITGACELTVTSGSSSTTVGPDGPWSAKPTGP